MKADILIRGGRVIDPSTGLDTLADVAVHDGLVAAVGRLEDVFAKETIDADGMLVAPGFMDLHCHLREPGSADETIESGTQAAAAGGFTAVCAMPNTTPPVDSPAMVEYITLKARSEANVRVLPIGTITKNRQGLELAELALMAEKGAVAFSDDGSPVADGEMMRRALEYSKIVRRPIIEHCEDLTLTNGGEANEGPVTTWLGLNPIPRASEECMVARNLVLAIRTKGRLHLAHLSTGLSISLFNWAKGYGANISAEVTPHHLALTDELLAGFETYAKVNPPLRGEEDRAAVALAAKNGLVDAIATDHAPWSDEKKKKEFKAAPNGISGLETAIAMSWTALVIGLGMEPSDFIARFTTGPARVLGCAPPSLSEGSVADITLIDPKTVRAVEPKDFASWGKNSPAGGMELSGWPRATIIAGRAAMLDGVVRRWRI